MGIRGVTTAISRVKNLQVSISFRPFIGVIPLYLGAQCTCERQARQALEVQGAPEAQEESWIDVTRFFRLMGHTTSSQRF